MTIEQKTKFLESVKKDILAKARTYHIEGMDSEDVAQELFISAWVAINKYDERRANIRTFIHYVIQNRLRDLSRATKRKKRKINKDNLISIEHYLENNKDIEDKNWQKNFVSFLSDPNNEIWK